MKYYFWSFLTMMMTMLCVGFTSCGDDDEEDGTAGMSDTEIISKLQGTWTFNSGTETVNGYTVQMSKSDLDEIKSMMSQAMGARVYFWDETLEFSGYKVNGVSYSLNGQQLIMDGMELLDGFTISVKSVTSTTLVLHEVFVMEGVSIVADMEYLKEGADDIIDNTENENTETIIDFTATSSVKKLIMEPGLEFGRCVFYEDYNNLYSIHHYDGNLYICHYVRSGGGWDGASDKYTCGLKDIGKVSGINSITSKTVTGGDNYMNGWGYGRYGAKFQPKHGYAVMFTTEDGVKKFMRLYAESYTLDDNHNLWRVTIQYQLY